MGDGLDRAGHMQSADAVDSVLISTTMGAASATGAWYKLRVLSTEAIFKSITAAGITNISQIDSGTTYAKDWYISGSKITAVELSTALAAGLIIAHKKELL